MSISLCIWSNVRPVSLSLPIVDLRDVLICLRALKDLSDEQDVTGKVQSKRRRMPMLA